MNESDRAGIAQIANRLHGSVSRLFHRLRVTRESGSLSLAKLGVLAQLRRESLSTATALAGYLGVQPQSLTRLLAESEKEGLIRRRRDQLDKRRSVIEITSAGARQLAKEARRREWQLAAAMDRVLTPVEQELLGLAIGLMERLSDAIEPEEKRAASKMETAS